MSSVESQNSLPKQSRFCILRSQNDYQNFWQLWESHRDYFYRLCLKWMGNNSHDAEDVLAQAMIKAFNKWEKSANEIKHPKAWLQKLIHNLCMDIHRKRQQESIIIDNIDDLKVADNSAFTSGEKLPESDILDREMWTYLRYTIECLPDKLRHPFVLHYYHEKSYQDIAQQLALSEDNIRKRIQEARKILQKQLNKYLAGEDNTSLNFLSLSLKKDIPMPENDQSNQTLIGHCQLSTTIPVKPEEINYFLTSICLETLPNLSYNSLASLGWR